MNFEKVRIGIIGSGWIVENAHLPALSDLDEAEVVALFDVDLKRAQSVCDKFSIKHALNDWESFLEVGLDAVIIATPNFTHVDYSLKALNRGIHVLCEKPVAFKAEEIEEIISVCEKKNVLYIPGFVNRWREDIQEVYKTIQSGEIGEIQYIDAGWLRKYGVPRPGTWFTNKALSGGGVLVDIGSHVIDICLMLLGNKKPLRYQLSTSLLDEESTLNAGAANWFKADYTHELAIDVEDTALANVEYEDGTVLDVKVSWLAGTKGDSTYFKIKGTKGSIHLQTLFGFSNERLYMEDTLEVILENRRIVKQFSKDAHQAQGAFKQMARYFVQAILKNKVDYTSSQDALKAVSMIENLYQVANEND